MPTSSNLLCGCGYFMRVKRNSVTVEELMEDGAPYKLWDADLFECEQCGVQTSSPGLVAPHSRNIGKPRIQNNGFD